MSQKEIVLEECLTALSVYLKNEGKFTPIVLRKHMQKQVENFSLWLKHHFEILHTEWLYDENYQRNLRCYVGHGMFDIKMEAENGYRTFFNWSFLFSQLLYFYYQNAEYFQKEIREMESVGVPNQFIDIDDNKFLQLFIRGILSCYDFGMCLLMKHFPINTYVIDDVLDNLYVTVQDVYNLHLEQQTKNSLFAFIQMGDNGVDILYDSTFCLQFRIGVKEEKKGLWLYITRKDKRVLHW